MIRVLSRITFTQQPTTAFPDRNGVIAFSGIHECEIYSAWKELTDTCTITLPRNVYITDKSGRRFSLGGGNVNLGGFLPAAPVFLRGDKVLLEWTYATGDLVTPYIKIFDGYISQVLNKKPFVIEVEDNMYKLKQVQATGGNRGFFNGKKYTVESMLTEMIKNSGLPFTVNNTTSTSVGDFITHNETICEVLARLRKDFHFEAYFRGNELRCGSFVYIEQDAINSGPKIFKFQRSYVGVTNGCIISDELEYKRKDDIVLSAVAKNTIEQETGKTTKDGQKKTKKVRLEVLVTYANGAATPTVIVGTKENPIPPNTGGERRTFHYLGATTTAELTRLATNELKKYYYTGFRGKFKTLGIPFVSHGDNIDIIDPSMPERNGRYKCKAVRYSGGVSGLRQEPELDYLIFRLDEKGKPILT